MLQILNRRKSGGFTLIELLVVIAIIGILATIVLVSLNSARQKARNARRESDIRQVAIAAEMFYDANSAYPSAANYGAVSFGSFLTSKPVDPLNTGANVYVWVDNSGNSQKYAACATMEGADAASAIFFARESGSGMAASCPAL